MFVSALSQMWIFGLYELLRTWRARIRSLTKWKDSGAIPEMLRRVQGDDHNLAALMKSRHLERMRDDPGFKTRITAHFDTMEHVFRMTESIRMNLAKHEIQGKPNSMVRAPGYGRINSHCGALDFESDAQEITVTSSSTDATLQMLSGVSTFQIQRANESRALRQKLRSH